MADLKWLVLIVCCVAPIAQAADDLESLDADFLSYLAEFEGEDEDWTIVEAPPGAKPVAPSATKPPAAEPGKKPAATQPATESRSER